MTKRQSQSIAHSRRVKRGYWYEQVVAEIHRQLYEEISIEQNILLVGASQVPRQVDVALRGSLGGTSFLNIVECKKKHRRVTIQDVDAFVGKMEDLRAHAGIIASDSGFTSGAKSRAQAHGRISLISVFDIENADLRSKIGMLFQATFHNFQWPFKLHIRDPNSVAESNGVSLFVASYLKENLTAHVKEFFDWTQAEGKHAVEGTHQASFEVEHEGVNYSFTFEFAKTIECFRGFLALQQARGSFDHVSGRTKLVGQTWTTQELGYEYARDNWERIDCNEGAPSGVPHVRRHQAFDPNKAESVAQDFLRGLGLLAA